MTSRARIVIEQSDDKIWQANVERDGVAANRYVGYGDTPSEALESLMTCLVGASIASVKARRK